MGSVSNPIEFPKMFPFQGNTYIRGKIDVLYSDLKEIHLCYFAPYTKATQGALLVLPNLGLPRSFVLLLFQRNATPSGRIRLSTGIADVADLAKVVSYQGRKRLKWWKGHHCNAIKGTDGSLFHPGVTKNETLQVFTSELCQSLPLVYQGETQVEGIPAYR